MKYIKKELQSKKDYKKAPFSDVHWRVYISILLGQIACGYALGISGIALDQAGSYLPLTNFWTGLIGAGGLIGLFGSIFMGRLADKVGRKGLLMLNMYIFTILSLAHLFVTNLFLIFLLRLGLGLMMAIDYTVGNALLIEWLPTGESGKKQSRLLIYWSIGFILAYLIGSYLGGFSQGWKYSFASSFIFGLIAAVFRSFAKIPASPSWLASRGKNAKAQKVIQRNLGSKWGLSERLLSIKVKNISWLHLFSKKYRRQTLVGGLFYASQAFSFFGISIFLPILLKSMGVTNADMSGILYNGSMLIGVVIGIWIFNKISRRSFLVVSFLSSAIALAAMIFLDISMWAKLGIFSLFSVILSSSLVLDYPYPSELFDVKVRATGMGICIAISRIGAACGTFLLPILTDMGGSQLAMLVCALVLFIGSMICLVWAPETSPKFIKKNEILENEVTE